MSELIESLTNLGETGKRQIIAAASLAELERTRVELLGRQGTLTQVLRQVGQLPVADRPLIGQRANELRQSLEAALADRLTALRAVKIQDLASQPLDLTAPGVRLSQGHRHPVSLVLDELVRLFWQMGYQVAEGPEVETDWYNFEALLLGPNHPARDMQDTFYLDNGNLVRTHTSSVQIRYMEEHQPPIRIIAPGKVYRNEDEDPTHSWSFQQVEGLVVDEGISLADLKGTLVAMLQGLLGEGTELRLRPNYFPYTEPSVEVDARRPDGEWLELGGAGMVHPEVLRNVGIDPECYSGFAFGFGFDRIAILKYGIEDVRLLWRPDLRLLERF